MYGSKSKHNTSCRRHSGGYVRPHLLALLSLAFVAAGSFWASPASAQRDRRRRRSYDRRRRRRNTKRKTGSKDVRSKSTRGKPATDSLLAGEHEFNQCRRFPAHKKIKITLKPDSELHDLIAWISGMTCKRFIVGSNVRAQKVTIYSPTPVTAREAYRAFLSALNVMGLTVKPAGRYLKIVEAREKGLSTLCTPGRSCPRDGRIITQLARVKHVNPDEIKGVLEGLKSKDGNIITYPDTNLLIITDVGRVVARLLRVLRYLDVESEGERIWVVRVQHAVASELAEKLQEVFDVGGGKGGKKTQRRRVRRGRRRRAKRPTSTAAVTTGGSKGVRVSKILPDDRTNLLIVVADEKSYLKVRALIRKLDIPIKGGEERIHVVALANADAEELSDTLAGLTGGAGGRRASGRSRRGRRRRGSRSRGRTGGSTVGLFEGEVQITADAPTNSLVIVASVKDYLSLKNVIKKLDVPRRQVFVEATILEVSLSKTRDLGMAFHGGKPVGSGDDRSLLLFGNNAAKSITIDPASLMGLAVGLRGPELQDAESLLGIPGISFPTFGAFFTALQSDNDVNVVSQPHILTTDNEEAVIEVGENVPFQAGIGGVPSLGGLTGAAGAAGQAGTSALGVLPMMSIQRQDVTLKLKIVPHVNESDFVKLEIEQEMNEVKSIDPVVGPTTTKKKVKTVIVVKDQQTAVLGGLITEKEKRNDTKVPLLGDIPILGYLFKSTKRVKEKSNLLIFLTPYVIRDQSDLRRIFRHKLQQRKEFLERHTVFEDFDVEAHIDYRHKRGLLEEINRTAWMAEEEERMRKKAMEESREVDVEGPVIIQEEDRRAIKRLEQSSNESKDDREVDDERGGDERDGEKRVSKKKGEGDGERDGVEGRKGEGVAATKDAKEAQEKGGR
jgi:general secretion pathway protein D